MDKMQTGGFKTIVPKAVDEIMTATFITYPGYVMYHKREEENDGLWICWPLKSSKP